MADPTSEDDPSLAVDVELISVNAEVLTSAVELSVPSSPFAPRDPFCASCQYFVENFYIQWMLQLHRQREKAQANPNAREWQTFSQRRLHRQLSPSLPATCPPASPQRRP